MHNILIVEDDIALNNGIVLTLKNEEYSFQQAYDIKKGRELLDKEDFNLIILDINLPDGSGLDFCREIRQASRVPIIILTANDMEIDVVTGFELGADDYITKPFSLMILRARVAALLRRAQNNNVNTRILIGEFTFDFDTMEFSKNGCEIILSKTEQRLLKILVNNKGTVLSRVSLVDKIWTDGAEYVEENALSVTINRLRNKLEDSPSKPKYIQTVYGIGYTWATEKDE
jgi:two-component system response regulator RegX3